jgi:hypothetical protein
MTASTPQTFLLNLEQDEILDSIKKDETLEHVGIHGNLLVVQHAIYSFYFEVEGTKTLTDLIRARLII